MAETTGIAWADATFNPWIGCTEVSTAASGGGGCDNCYARTLDNRHRWGGATHWGAGKPRMRTSPANWRKPLVWQRYAEQGIYPDGKRVISDGHSPRVFCASLADVFDNEIPEQWRLDLFELIYDTPALTWLLLTKRIGNAAKMIPPFMHPVTLALEPLKNVWLGATIVNQEEADRDLPKLLATPAAKHFVSYEPALGPVNWRPWLISCGPGIVSPDPRGRDRAIDWIIIGGESSTKARPFKWDWARDTIRQCREAGAAPFMKQTGTDLTALYERVQKDRNGADPAEWPEDLRVQEFPQ